MSFHTIEEALSALKSGEIIIVVDDEDRENEGDLVVLAEKATPEAINFMITHGRGLVCVPMTEERVQELDLSLMVNHNLIAREGGVFAIHEHPRQLLIWRGCAGHMRGVICEVIKEDGTMARVPDLKEMSK